MLLRFAIIVVVLNTGVLFGRADKCSQIIPFYSSRGHPVTKCLADGAFTFYQIGGAMSWQAAQDLCVMWSGGNLISIHTPNENMMVNSQFPNTWTWTALHAKDWDCASNTWVNVDGTPTDFTYWRDGQPNCGDNVRQCVFIRSNSMWYCATCVSNLPVLCKTTG